MLLRHPHLGALDDLQMSMIQGQLRLRGPLEGDWLHNIIGFACILWLRVYQPPSSTYVPHTNGLHVCINGICGSSGGPAGGSAFSFLTVHLDRTFLPFIRFTLTHC